MWLSFLLVFVPVYIPFQIDGWMEKIALNYYKKLKSLTAFAKKYKLFRTIAKDKKRSEISQKELKSLRMIAKKLLRAITRYKSQ